MITFCPSCEAEGVVYRCDIPRDPCLIPRVSHLLPLRHSLSVTLFKLGLVAKSHPPGPKSESPLTDSLTHVRLGYTQVYSTKFFHSLLRRINFKVTQHKALSSGNDQTHRDNAQISNSPNIYLFIHFPSI